MFYKPICEKSDVLSQLEIKAIFSDIDIIKSVSDSLLNPLRERVQNWSKTQKLGDVFLMIVNMKTFKLSSANALFFFSFQSDYLRVYSEYVKGYAHALTILSKFDKGHPFTKFYASQLKKAPESYSYFRK